MIYCTVHMLYLYHSIAYSQKCSFLFLQKSVATKWRPMHEGSPLMRDFLLWWGKSGQGGILCWWDNFAQQGLNQLSFNNIMFILLALGKVAYPQHDNCRRQSFSGKDSSFGEKSLSVRKCSFGQTFPTRGEIPHERAALMHRPPTGADAFPSG